MFAFTSLMVCVPLLPVRNTRPNCVIVIGVDPTVNWKPTQEAK